MASSINAEKVKLDAARVLSVWSKNSSLQVKDSSLDTYTSLYNDPAAKLDELNALVGEYEERLTTLRNQRDDQAKALHAVTVRARTSIKGALGEDSSEYELAGGTRASERKKSGKTKTPATPATK